MSICISVFHSVVKFRISCLNSRNPCTKRELCKISPINRQTAMTSFFFKKKRQKSLSMNKGNCILFSEWEA